jgi:sulfatase maturation enzyme AslB (radical SAM superfamily)
MLWLVSLRYPRERVTDKGNYMIEHKRNHYSDLKAAWHLDNIALLRRGELPPVTSIQVVLSDFCNHDCSFCFYRRSNNHTDTFADGEQHNPRRYIPLDVINTTIDQAAEMGTKSMVFTGGGEPTMYKKHVEVFNRALDKGIAAGLITNGAHIKDTCLESLMRFTWVRVSLDAATPETYKELRRVRDGEFEKVLNNVTRMVKRRAETKSSVTIGLSFVVTEDNVEEIPLAIKIANQINVDYLRIMPEVGRFGKDPDSLRQANALIEDTPTNVKIYNLLFREDNDKITFSKCRRMGSVIYIGGDSKIYACCQVSYTLKGCIGDLSKQDYAQWHEENKHTLIENFDPNSCGRCVYANTNNILEYLSSNPDHVDFI